MAPFSILPDALEDELHVQRLLRVEERPFERIKGRLLGPSTPFHAYLTQKAADSTDTEKDIIKNESESKENQAEEFSIEQHAKFVKDLQRFREDVILDFAAFEASIARIQFLRDANVRERQRYTAEKLRIEVTAQEVREDTARLKVRLDEAKETLEVRKGYDILAETITKDVRLKPRDEQDANIERLKSEIEELKNEGVELEHTWAERREQFARVVEEGQKLRRVVRDEKEAEPEHEQDEKGERDGDEDGSDDGDENMLGVERQRDDGSNIGTPRPSGDDAPTPLPDLQESGAMTPRSIAVDANDVAAFGKQEENDQRLQSGEVGHDADLEMPDDETEVPNQKVPKVKIDDEMDTS